MIRTICSIILVMILLRALRGLFRAFLGAGRLTVAAVGFCLGAVLL